MAGKKLIQFRKKSVHKQSFQIVYVVENGFRTLRGTPYHINIATGACATAESSETEHVTQNIASQKHHTNTSRWSSFPP